MQLSQKQQLSAVLRNAWATVRLDSIRDAVRLTILELEAESGRNGSSGEGAPIEPEREDAREHALRAVTLQLREETGVADKSTSCRQKIVAPSLQWGLLYGEFLESYQSAAVASLLLSLGSIAGAAVEPTP